MHGVGTGVDRQAGRCLLPERGEPDLRPNRLQHVVIAIVCDAKPPGSPDPDDFPPELRRVRDKLSKIEGDARDRAEEFLDVAEEAEEGRLLIDWYERDAWPNLDRESRADVVSGSLDPSSARSYLDHLESAEKAMDEGEEAAKAAFTDVGFVASGMSTATGSTVTSARGHLEKDGDTFNLTFPQFDRGRKQQRIDRQLRQLDAGDLVDGRHGAWEAFRRDAADANAQACHSMRGVLTDLLDQYSPVEEVQRAEWWEPDDDARDGVTKRQKIRYFVAGDRRIEVDAEEMDRQVDRAYAAHHNAVGIAHGEQVDREATRAALIALEDAIGTLLNQRENYRMRGGLRPGAAGIRFD